jgi:flavin reductase (DIM6/NTAB) family NADH-FMN oxidoreductase RutF
MKKSLGAHTIIYPTPVLVVGTYDAEGRANVMTAAWGGICCSEPPCLCVSVRRSRHTYSALVERREFTVSLPSEAFVAAADYFGIVSGRDVDKFTATGLTAARSDLVDAPYVAEFPLAAECMLKQTLDLGTHTLFVGEIVDIKVDEDLLDGDGHPSVEGIKPIAHMPGGDYVGLGGSLGAPFSLGRRYVGDNAGE